MTSASSAPDSLIRPAPKTGDAGGRSLLELLYDGFLALFVMKNGRATPGKTGLINQLGQFLDDFSVAAAQQGIAADDIDAARYAFCAAADEIMAHRSERCGPTFFDRLATLRVGGSAHLQTLEVFHMCLMLGFRGHMTSGALEELRGRLGEDIAHMRGHAARHGPTRARPVGSAGESPAWRRASALAMLCALGCIGLRTAASAAHTGAGTISPTSASSVALSSGLTK
jgi:type VI secretion system protein ImpK